MSETQTEKTDKLYVVAESTLKEVVNVLHEKPYKEVAGLMSVLLTSKQVLISKPVEPDLTVAQDHVEGSEL